MYKYYMRFNFKEWLLVENTVGQILKTRYRPEIIQAYTAAAMKYLKTRPWAAEIHKDKLSFLAKWLTYQQMRHVEQGQEAIKKTGGSISDLTNMYISSPVEKNPSRWVPTDFHYAIDRLRIYQGSYDYLATMFATNFNAIRSKLNNPDYNPDDLNTDSQEWHAALKAKKLSEGPEGRYVPLKGMPKGWKWVSLDKGYCTREGGAMGHCGNAGWREGDNIYSLRDSKNIPHLTFIVNNGVLGESKGRGNDKPTEKYHPMIIALLLGEDNGKEIVGHIAGGGYLPENNFHFEDLNKEQQETVLKQKPYMLDYFEFIKSKAKGDPAGAKKLIDDDFDFKFEKIDFEKGVAKVVSWSDYQDMVDWLKDNTSSNLKELPDFEEGFQDWYFNVSTKDAIETFHDSANDGNDKLMDEVIELVKTETFLGVEDKEDKDDEDTEYDLDWAVEHNDDVDSALKNAAEDGMRMGAENDAWQSVSNFFDRERDENDFRILKLNRGGWELEIDMQSLAKLRGNLNGERLDYIINFEYSSPYNGYQGFDDSAYNERLGDLLKEVKDTIEIEITKRRKILKLTPVTQ